MQKEMPSSRRHPKKEDDASPIFWSNRDEIVQWEEQITLWYDNSSME